MHKKALFTCVLLALMVACSGCKPHVTWKIPAAGAKEVKGHKTVKVWFNTRIDNSTLDLNLACNGNPVAGAVEITTNTSGTKNQAEFTPTNYLHAGDTCTATIGAGLKSYKSGLATTFDYSWSFTIDTTPPSLNSMTDSGAVSAGTLIPVAMRFNEPIGDIDYSFSTAHFGPIYWWFRKNVTVRALKMEAGNSYTFRLTGFTDTAGNYTAIDREIVLTAE